MFGSVTKTQLVGSHRRPSRKPLNLRFDREAWRILGFIHTAHLLGRWYTPSEGLRGCRDLLMLLVFARRDSRDRYGLSRSQFPPL